MYRLATKCTTKNERNAINERWT